jgi:hypothetical protein
LAAEAKQCVLTPQETAALLDFDPAYDRYGVTKRRTLSEHIWSAVAPESGPPHFAPAQVFYGRYWPASGCSGAYRPDFFILFPLSLSGPQRCCDFTLPKFHVRAKMRT